MNSNDMIGDSHLQIQRCRIGKRIKEFREKKGYSQEKLAELMNVSRTTISKIEGGKFNCSIDYLAKFAVFLNFEIDLKEV